MKLDPAADRQDRFRRALGEGHELSLRPMQGAHPFSISVEGQLGHPAQRRMMVQSMAISKVHEGDLRWISGHNEPAF